MGVQSSQTDRKEVNLIDLHDSITLKDVKDHLDSEEQEALINLYDRIGYPIQ